MVQSNGVPVNVNPAFGIAPFRLGEARPRDVLRTAHSAAQDARDSETGIGIYSADLDDAHRRRFTLLADMRAAVASSDQLSLVYQPRVDVGSGSCLGAEALLRWRHPVLGNIPPGEFIPLVEQTALVKDVTEWVIGAALRQTAEWRSRNINLKMSINISAANLEEEGFAADLIERLRQLSVPSHAIELELTESAIIRNGQHAINVLGELKAAGIPIAIDDFGTGYSSLSYLQKIPASSLKIDRSFMRTLLTEERARTLVSAMISMAHDLHYRVVAEGVETAEVHDWLAEQSCDEIQGYFFSRPLPVAAFESWLCEYQARTCQREPVKRRA